MKTAFDFVKIEAAVPVYYGGRRGCEITFIKENGEELDMDDFEDEDEYPVSAKEFLEQGNKPGAVIYRYEEPFSDGDKWVDNKTEYTLDKTNQAIILKKAIFTYKDIHDIVNIMKAQQRSDGKYAYELRICRTSDHGAHVFYHQEMTKHGFFYDDLVELFNSCRENLLEIRLSFDDSTEHLFVLELVDE